MGVYVRLYIRVALNGVDTSKLFLRSSYIKRVRSKQDKARSAEEMRLTLLVIEVPRREQ